jgi:hypothetical protein
MDSLSGDHRRLDQRSITVRKLNIVREAAGGTLLWSILSRGLQMSILRHLKWRIRVRIL